MSFDKNKERAKQYIENHIDAIIDVYIDESIERLSTCAVDEIINNYELVTFIHDYEDYRCTEVYATMVEKEGIND